MRWATTSRVEAVPERAQSRWMIGVIARWTILSLGAWLLLSACATGKFHAEHPGGDRREIDDELAGYVAARTVPIWIPNQPKIREGDVSFHEMTAGQAALISTDGYALTANHVVAGDAVAFTVHLKSDPTGWMRAGRLIGGTVLLAGAGGTERPVAQRDLLVQPVRVVHRFPGVDVALIKTGFQPINTFELADHVPSEGEPVAVAMNPLKGFRNGVATGGVVGRREGREPETWRAYATCVADYGDSGGSVVGADGRLVGVTVGAVYFRRPWRLLNGEWFDFRMDGASRAAVEQAIADDRKRRRRPG